MTRRIHVTGNAGSGKTTLAARIGARFDLPVAGLDAVVWQSGWRKTPRDERRKLVTALTAADDWVIEGYSPDIAGAADVVIFLDVGRATAYWRCMRRNWRYLFRSRPGLPANCPEYRIVPYLIRLIWRFHRHIRPALLAAAAESPERWFHVRSAQQLERALRAVDQALAERPSTSTA